MLRSPSAAAPLIGSMLHHDHSASRNARRAAFLVPRRRRRQDARPARNEHGAAALVRRARSHPRGAGSTAFKGSLMATATTSPQGTGRRKRAVARVRLSLGSGEIKINDRPIEQYLGRATLLQIVR